MGALRLKPGLEEPAASSLELEERARLAKGLYTLNPIQEQFVFSDELVCGYYGGIGNGKTLAGCLRALMLSDMYPGNVGLVGRLTYPELRDTTQKQMLDIVRIRNGGTLEPGPYVESYNQTSNTLVLRNKSVILFRYLENEQSILNLNLGWFYVDQAEFVKEGIFGHLLGRLRRWSQEEVARFERQHGHTPRHFAFITGNPAPGWVHRRFKLGKTEDGKPLDYKLYEAPTSANRDHLPKGYEDGLRASYPKAWVERYLEGSWETFSGQVYKEYSHKLHVIQPFEVPAHWPRFVGWDHGKTNPTSVTWQAVDEHGYVVLYKEYYQVSAVIAEHAAAVMQLCKGDSVPRDESGKAVLVWMDPGVAGDTDPEGRDFRQLYQELGIVGLVANKKVAAGIEKVSTLLHPDPTLPFPDWHPRGCKKDARGRIIRPAELGSPRVFIFDTCVAHIHEIELYRYKERRMGELLNAHEEPVKYMDHAMDSWRYSSMAIFDQAQPLVKMRKTMNRTAKPFVNHVLAKLLAMG